MTYEPYAETLHRLRADQLQRDAVADTIARHVRRTRRLEFTARLLGRLARRLEARAGMSRARAL